MKNCLPAASKKGRKTCADVRLASRVLLPSMFGAALWADALLASLQRESQFQENVNPKLTNPPAIKTGAPPH